MKTIDNLLLILNVVAGLGTGYFFLQSGDPKLAYLSIVNFICASPKMARL